MSPSATQPEGILRGEGSFRPLLSSPDKTLCAITNEDKPCGAGGLLGLGKEGFWPGDSSGECPICAVFILLI